VDVPAKNQRRIIESDSLPNRYDIYWDGEVCLVGWEHNSDESIPLSGGHVVIDVTKTALEALDFGLYVQACNPELRLRVRPYVT
jgi:hypothetical protein